MHLVTEFHLYSHWSFYTVLLFILINLSFWFPILTRNEKYSPDNQFRRTYWVKCEYSPRGVCLDITVYKQCTDRHNSSLWGWWGPGTGCPEKLWLPPPWQCSRPGWMGLWATLSSGRCPWSWQGWWNQIVFKVTSNPNHSMILWI